MWTKEQRRRQAAFERRRYPSDLTDAEWERIKPLLPKPAWRGRKPKVDLREILNAIRYLARAGCSWRMLPIHFGPWQTVYWWFRRFVRRLLFRTLHDVALMLDREQAGREASPSAGVIDSRDFVIEIVRKLAGQQGFHVLPRRWVVERSFGWMMRWRRLVRDYEERCDVSEAMIHVGMGSLLLRRISHP